MLEGAFDLVVEIGRKPLVVMGLVPLDEDAGVVPASVIP